MKTQFQVLEWSLNLYSNLEAQIPKWVFSSIKSQDSNLPEIIFLNEVVTANDSCRKLLEQIEEEKYRVICSNNNHGNQVAIALSSDFKIKNIVYQIPYVQTYYVPDFLHVEAEYNGTLYNFVALRIRVGSHKSKEPVEYKHRNIQFQCYKHYISKLTNVISAGDFNNSRIIGNEKGLFEQSQKIYEDRDCLQRFYNYQMICNEVYKESGGKLKLYTPEEMVSSIGIWNENTKKFEIPNATLVNNKYDHIVLSNTIIFANENKRCCYDWGFYSNLTKEDTYVYEKKTYIKKGCPDHAQLRVTISLGRKD